MAVRAQIWSIVFVPSTRKRRRWADLMRHAFGIDVLACPALWEPDARTGHRMILAHLGLPGEAVRPTLRTRLRITRPNCLRGPAPDRSSLRPVGECCPSC